MTPQTPDAKKIFLEAVEKHAPDGWPGFLDEACAGDSALRDQVEALLKAHGEPNRMLDGTGVVVGSPLSPDGPQPDLDDLKKRSFGDFRILGEIGRGGMGVVLKGRDAGLNRLVAIKVLAPQLASNPVARERFRREARAAAAVSHEHVVAIHAVDETDGLPFLVMEFVSGRSLEERIQCDGTLELKEILRIAMQVAAGLAAAHAQGLVHRDIKPSNILLENGVERVKITDFGLARAADDVHFTQPGVVAGTLQYMSPEQARGEAVDHRSDLFSLGCVLYAMCTGRPPFRAETFAGVIRRTCEDTPRPIREVNPEMPDWLIEIIDCLLAKDPAERFQLASEVSELLGGHLAHLQEPDAAPRPARVPPPARIRRPEIARRRRRRFVLAMIVTLPVLGILAMTEATGVTTVVDAVATVLHIKTPQGTLVVEIDDPDVQVLIDGEEVVFQGVGPKEIRLCLGPHELHATKDGKPFQTTSITISRGSRQVVKVEMPEPTAPATPLQGDAVQWPVAEGGNGHAYVVLHKPGGITWDEADRQAKAAGGYLATITSAAENDFVFSLIDKSESRCKRPNKSVVLGPWIGAVQAKGAVEPAGGWKWVTDEVFAFENWRFPEPNDFRARDSEGENRICFAANSGKHASQWSDQSGTRRDVISYVVELGQPKHQDPPPKPLDSVLGVALSYNLYRVVVSGGGRTEELTEVGTYQVGLPSGPCRVELYTSARNELIRTIEMTIPHGRPRLVEIVARWKRLPVAIPPSPAPSALLASESPVRSIDVTADGKTVATASSSGEVGLWELDGEAWQQRATLQGDTGEVSQARFSGDGKRLVTLGDDNTVRLWNVTSGRLLKILLSDAGTLYTVAISPDGKTVAAGGREGVVHLVDAETGQRRGRLVGHIGRVYCVAFAPDGKAIATTGEDSTIRLWDAATGNARKTLRGHTNIVRQIAFSPDGRMLASASDDTAVNLWELETGRVIETLANPTAMVAVAFSPDGKTIAAAGLDQTVRLWDWANREQRANFYAHCAKIAEIAFLPDGKTLATASRNAGVKLWNIASLESPRPIGPQPKTTVVLRTWGHAVAFDPHGDRFATMDVSGRASVWDLKSLDRRASFKAHANWVWLKSMVFSPDGKRLFTCSNDKTMKVWNCEPYNLLGTITDARPFAGMDLSPDGVTALAIYEDNHALTLWDTSQEEAARTFRSNQGYLYAAAFSPDGSLVAAGTSAGFVLFWDPLTGEQPHPALEHGRSSVQALAFSPDGKTLATASHDSTVKLWDVAGSKELATLEGHSEKLFAVEFSPDGKYLVTAGGDLDMAELAHTNRIGELKLWDVAGRRLLAELPGHTGAVFAVAFSPDGKTLATGGRDDKVHLWDVAELLEEAAP